MTSRLQAALPGSWFPDDASNLPTVLQGAAYVASQTYANLLQTALLTRIKTASGNFLDIASNDYFGTGLPRITGEQDTFYSSRILAKITLEKVTYDALTTALTNMFAGTGVTFTIQEYVPGGANILIPLNSTPTGINSPDAFVRYGTPLQAFECLVTFADLPSENIELEDGSDLQMEDGSTTIDLEYLSTSRYSSLLTLLFDIKPIGTTIWTIVGQPLVDAGLIDETNNAAITSDDDGTTNLTP
jgi:hypothetical protein